LRTSSTKRCTPDVRFSADMGSPIMDDAALVVDAPGRGTLTLALLDALGWYKPDVTEIGDDIAHATVVVSVPVDPHERWPNACQCPSAGFSVLPAASADRMPPFEAVPGLSPPPLSGELYMWALPDGYPTWTFCFMLQA
jgi:hypothetical protein